MSKHSLRYLVLGLVLLAPLAHAETLDEVLAKNYEARGGLEKIRALNTVRVEGKMVMGGMMEAPFTLLWKRPNKIRIDFVFQGKTGSQAYDGETAWMYIPFMGKATAELMGEDERKAIEDQSDFDGALVDYAEKGHKVEYLGIEEIDGTEAHKLKLIKKSGEEILLYLDGEYYLEIKSVSRRTIRGQEVEIESVMGDYKDVKGLMIAHSVEIKRVGMPQGQMMTLQKIVPNVEIDDSKFVMPKEEAAKDPDEAAPSDEGHKGQVKREEKEGESDKPAGKKGSETPITDDGE